MRVDRATETEVSAELALEAGGVAHVFGGDVHRVEHLDADFDEIVEQRVDVSIRVVEDFGA